MMTMNRVPTFRPMLLADIPAVFELERLVYPQPWSEGVFRDELSHPDRAYVVAESDGDLIGFAGLMLVEQDAHVTTLAVRSQSRQNGLGTRLLLELIAAGLAMGASNLTLEVRASNTGAQRLYERFGMTTVGVRKHYYRDDDAVIMWATDIDGPEYQERLNQIRAHLEERS